jgi:hypothetical protein
MKSKSFAFKVLRFSGVNFSQQNLAYPPRYTLLFPLCEGKLSEDAQHVKKGGIKDKSVGY